MQLMEERLKTYTRIRETPGAVDPDSGLSTPPSRSMVAVQLDLQEDGRFQPTDDPGLQSRRGPLQAFTYDGDKLSPGDKIDTGDGLLEVVSLFAWDDVEPTHYEVALRLA